MAAGMVTLAMEPKLHERIKKHAKTRGVKMGFAVTEAITEYLAKQEGGSRGKGKTSTKA